MNFKYIFEQNEVDNLLPVLMESNTWGLDTETTGLNPHKDKVILLQIGNEGVQYVIDTRKVNVEPLRPFFESRMHRKICHNGKFDYKMIKGNFGMDTETIRDTYFAEKILKNGRKLSGFGLDDLVKAYLDISLPKDERSTFGQGRVPTEDFTTRQIEYAANDVKYLIPLLSAQANALHNDGVADIWILECNALPCFGDMEFSGMYIDQEGWLQHRDQNIAEAAKIEYELNEIAANVIQRDLFGEVHVNWNSPDQVLQVLKNLRVKVKEWDRTQKKFIDKIISKTDDKSLRRAKGLPIIKLLKRYRSLTVRVNTFGQPYIDAIDPTTGRLHMDVEQLGTETGRPANRTKKGSVNLLNIPKDKAFRNLFIAGPDEVVETDDYSGCELRIWAELSEDPHLTKAFLDGIDVHCYVASMLFNQEVKKGNPLRTPAKTLNFGGRK
jgi:DNA polymerase I-like protein with 3'-5' exonuclease and polymerase domains